MTKPGTLVGSDSGVQALASFCLSACMQDLWQKRSPPKPLDLDALVPQRGAVANGTAAREASASVALGLTNPHAQLSVKVRPLVVSL